LNEAGHFESTKPRKLLVLAVYLDSDDMLAANELCTQRKSEQEASEKVTEMIVEV